MPERGVFVTFEGGEGSGKSTQAALLAQRLRDGGLPVVALREPGGTPLGDDIRDLLLDPAYAGMDPMAELLLYEASRAQLVAETIETSLAAGRHVVCDRFTDSTTAYQGYGRGLDLEQVRVLNSAASRGLVPDLTVLVDVDPVLGLERACGQGADRLEAEDVAFHERVREGFLRIAAEKAERVVVVDGTPGVAEVAAAVRRVVAAALPVLRPVLDWRA
ncbi:MAG: dTMP kinase [Coriobacteriia bacterium]|nr:dTMP kinase [Coriobacteriia bacterium]